MKLLPSHRHQKDFLRFGAARSGFTLIELISTVAIICALAALLVPALSKMREKACATTCVANLRQIVLQAAVWSTDNDGWIPPARWLTDFGAQKGGVDRKLRQCPSLPNLPMPAPGKADTATSYGINNRLVMVKEKPNWGPNDIYYYTRGVYKMSSLSMKNTILFADSLSPGSKVGYYLAMREWFDARHGKLANVAYVDGHVEQKTAAELTVLDTWTRGIPDQEKN